MKYKYGNLGQLIYDCDRYGINTVETGSLPCHIKNPVRCGNFIFSANNHSTGISLSVLIIHPESNKTLQIISGTYWWSESTYGFNKFTWLRGKWDEPLAEAIDKLKDLLVAKVEAERKENQKLKEKKQSETQTEKEKFEAIF